MRFFEAVGNIFRIPDLRKRVLFTLALLAVYRLGGHIPTPGINLQRWSDFFSRNQGTIFGFFDLFAGGNIRRLTIFALGIMPYITASIILQLLTVVVPTLEKLQKEGELGRRKITQWTRYLTVFLALAQSFGIAEGLQQMQGNIVINPGFGFVMMTIISLTTGTAFIMWLGEQITDRGIGNGMSLIIFAGIVVGLPSAIGNIYTNVFKTREWSPLQLGVILIMMVARGGVHRACGTRGAPHSGAVCQARGRPPRHGRPVNAHAAQGQRRRCDSGYFRVLHIGLSADPAPASSGPEQ